MKRFIFLFTILPLAFGVGGCASSDLKKLEKEVNQGQVKVNQYYNKVQKYKSLYSEIRNQVKLSFDLYFGTDDFKGVRQIAIENKDQYTEEEWNRFKKMDEKIREFRELSKKVDNEIQKVFVKVEKGKAKVDEWFNKIQKYIRIARNLNENINDVINSAEE